MTLNIFASSSKGNCSVLSHGGTHILVDCGISMRRISGCLRALGLDESEIAAVVVTHEHSDHIAGLATMAKNYKIPVYASTGTARELEGVPHAAGVLRDFCAGGGFEIGDIGISSFSTPHDAADSVGFRFFAGGASLAYATDIGHVPDSLLEAICGADAVVIESNHDVEMLKNGPYPSFLKQRILGKNGHLSNELCAHTIKRLISSGTREIALAHLSQDNNTPTRAYETARAAASTMGAAREVGLAVAPVSGEMTIRVGGPRRTRVDARAAF